MKSTYYFTFRLKNESFLRKTKKRNTITCDNCEVYSTYVMAKIFRKINSLVIFISKILGYRDPRYKHEILSSQKVTKVTKDTKSYKKLHDITCRC